MKVTVDDERCRGHGVCCVACPEVFVLTDDGYTVVETPEVPVEFEEAVRSAAASCPERAITTS
ncbi:ferredoxin [Streptomyces sp. PSKA54]|uniref:Ferredoxin n=1 Tax=Streptomyces himalayensis subsp. aureolus TaxID=2758039 RepID=A0A7W2D2H1_9ACTN|nr:ferredoxin [Streptomyces himalayensis]MBA4863577.1 ferredoxin [Streptomyces himalayensis subsp. aureolus]